MKTDRIKYIDEEVLSSAPKATKVKDLVFFKVGKFICDDELEKEYISRGLTPVSPHNLFEYDKTNREKMDEMKYVATHWKDKDGKWCYAAFSRWGDGKRSVNVNRNDCDWHVD